MSDRRIHRVKIGKVTSKLLEYEPMVSDHAVVRYLERVLDLKDEVAELRGVIAREAQIAVLRRQRYVVVDDGSFIGSQPHVLVLKGQRVVTVLDANEPRLQVFA